jgi:site-specific recombinase XerD
LTIGTDALALYELEIKAKGFSKHTIRAFLSDVRQWLESGLEPKEWLATLKEKGRTNKTLARKVTSLRNYSELMNVELDLPTIKPEKKLPHALTTAEAKAILHEAAKTKEAERDSLIVALLLGTGLRSSELLGLRSSDILEPEQGQIFLIVRNGKGAKERLVPVARPELQKQLKKYAKGKDQLFTFSDRNLRKLIAKLGSNAGIKEPVSPHTLRHTFATDKLRGGATLEGIRRVLGHENLATTQIYLNLTEQDIFAEMARGNF